MFTTPHSQLVAFGLDNSEPATVGLQIGFKKLIAHIVALLHR